MKIFIRFTISLALILIHCPFAFAANERVLNIQEVTSAGGLKAWLVEDHSLPVIAIDFAFKGAGAVQDADAKQGTAQLLSNMLDEGAGDMDARAFQTALLDSSISLSFDATRDRFTGHVKTLTANKAEAFKLLTLALTKPRFDAEPLARMKAANQSRIRSDLSDPESIAARILNDTAYAGHPYARNSGGTLSSLSRITSADLKTFHGQFLGRNNLVITAAGDITAAELGLMLDAVFGALPEISPPPTPADIEVQNQGTITGFSKDIPQTIIEIMQPGIKREDPDYHLAQMMNFILGSSGFGSRLTEEIREKRGLTYGITSALTGMDHVDTLSISTSTENKNVAEMLTLIRAELKKMTSVAPSAKELEDAKSYLIGSLPLSLTSTDKISGLLLALKLDGLPVDYLDQRNLAIQRVTLEDVQRLAAKVLKPENLTIILVGKPEGIAADRTLETLPNVE